MGMSEALAKAKTLKAGETAAIAETKNAEAPLVKKEITKAGSPSKNMAGSLLNVVEQFLKIGIDTRLELDDEERKEGRKSLAPVIDKHDLAIGNGKSPYEEEMKAGFYFGGFAKRTMKKLKELRLIDAKKQKEKPSNNEGEKIGEERERRPTEQARTVSSEERVLQEPDAETEGWNSETFG